VQLITELPDGSYRAHNPVLTGDVSVGRGTLIGMGAVLLSPTRIGSECVIAAGTVLPPDLQIPDRMMVIGAPGRRELSPPDTLPAITKSPRPICTAGFLKTMRR